MIIHLAAMTHTVVLIMAKHFMAQANNLDSQRLGGS